MRVDFSELLAAWNRGRVSSRELLESGALDGIDIIRRLTPEARERAFHTLINALDQRRERSVPFGGLRNLVRFVRDQLSPAHEILREWNVGLRSTRELLASPFAHGVDHIRRIDRLGRGRAFQALAVALELRRARGEQFNSRSTFISFVRDHLYPSRRNRRQGRRKKRRAARARALEHGDQEENVNASFVIVPPTPAETGVGTGPTRGFVDRNDAEPTAGQRAAIMAGLHNLAVFAALPATLSPVMREYARVLALRVFGGWTLEKIAQLDGRSIDAVNQLWQQARVWVATDPGSSIATTIALPAIDDRVLHAIRDAPQLLSALSWRSFERLLARVLETLGYEVELQRGTKDGGVDIIALRQDPALGAHRYLVQAKRAFRRVGVEPVRELLFLKGEYHATKACLATTSTFTSGAWRLAQEHRWELELRDFNSLCEWLELLRLGKQ